MEISLSARQKRMLLDNEERGYITLYDTYKYYSTEGSRINALDRLLGFGYLKEVSDGKFKILKSK